VPFPSFDFVSLSGYTRARASVGDDADGGSRPTALGPVAWFALESEEDTLSQEFQLVSKNNEKLKWLAGLYYFNDRGAIPSLSFPFAPGIPPGPANIAAGIGNFKNEVRYISYAAFGQARYAFSNSFGVTLGGRYTRDRVNLDEFLSNFAPPGPGPAETSYTDFSPKASLDYKLGPALFYLAASKGYKSGGYSLSTLTTDPLKPEENRAIELGVKADVTSDLYLELAAFKYRYKNIQTTVNVSNTHPTELINAPLAEIYGVDLTSSWRIIRALQLSASVSYLPKANYVDFPQAPGWIPNGAGLTPMTIRADGNRMQHAPRVSGNVRALYDRPMPGGANLSAGINVSYMGQYEGDPQDYEFDREGGYTLIDTSFIYSAAPDRWSVSLWCKNLADRQYSLSKIPSAAVVFGWQGEPRTYGITVNMKY
jgi:iron complex outermembrane receptor protein